MLKHRKLTLLLCSAVGCSVAANSSRAETPGHEGPTAALDEIIVTAQRRSENIQNVPISVSALTGEQLEARGAASAEDITSLVPAVVFNSGVGGGQITIRGIGGTNSGADPGNAVYIDNVYQKSPASNLFYFNAVDRIEVLKGPQGTLFGRNSTGGLVHVITRDPSTEKAAGEMSVGYGNYDTISGNLYLNVPVTNALAVNLAAFGFKQRDGWGHNLGTGSPTYLGYAWGARIKAKWDAPDGSTDVTLAGYYNKDRPVGFGPGTLPPGMVNMLGEGSLGAYNANTSEDGVRTGEQYTVSGTIHHDLGFARLTSITAYDWVRTKAVIDGDATPLPILNVNINGTYRTFSQEFHLESESSSRLRWMVGFLYLHSDNPGAYIFRFPPPPLGPGTLVANSQVNLRSYAGFGQATYAVTDDTNLTLGLRYTDDSSALVSPPAPRQSARAGKPTWRVAVDHKFTPDVLGYASYSRGFKSGLFNPTAPSHGPAAPETLDAYEIGVKIEAFDHRLRVNAAAFYYSFDSVQVQLFDPTTGSAYIANGGSAHSKGLDLDLEAKPVPRLSLTAGLSIMQTKFTSGVAPCYAIPARPAVGAVLTPSCSLVGNQLPFAPKTAASLGANYKIPTDVGDFALSANYSYNSGYYSDPSNFGPTHTPPSDMINVSATWISSSGNLNATVWGKNLLNQHIVTAYNVGAGVGNIAIGFPLSPFTFGGTVGVKF